MSYLIYVNELGPNYKGDNTYEFIFSNGLEEIWGDSWESNPANGYPSPPDLEFINKVGTLKSSEITLSVIQKSDYFSMTLIASHLKVAPKYRLPSQGCSRERSPKLGIVRDLQKYFDPT